MRLCTRLGSEIIPVKNLLILNRAVRFLVSDVFTPEYEHAARGEGSLVPWLLRCHFEMKAMQEPMEHRRK